LSWARAHGTGGSAFGTPLAFQANRGSALFASPPCTRKAGASANTNTLPVLPTSAGRKFTSALIVGTSREPAAVVSRPKAGRNSAGIPEGVAGVTSSTPTPPTPELATAVTRVENVPSATLPS
jgi:hypothetical protein